MTAEAITRCVHPSKGLLDPSAEIWVSAGKTHVPYYKALGLVWRGYTPVSDRPITAINVSIGLINMLYQIIA
jgi:hypothetical protein